MTCVRAHVRVISGEGQGRSRARVGVGVGVGARARVGVRVRVKARGVVRVRAWARVRVRAKARTEARDGGGDEDRTRLRARPKVSLAVPDLLVAPLGLFVGVPRRDVVVLLRGHGRRVVVLAEGLEVLLQVPLPAVLVHDALDVGQPRQELLLLRVHVAVPDDAVLAPPTACEANGRAVPWTRARSVVSVRKCAPVAVSTSLALSLSRFERFSFLSLPFFSFLDFLDFFSSLSSLRFRFCVTRGRDCLAVAAIAG